MAGLDTSSLMGTGTGIFSSLMSIFEGWASQEESGKLATKLAGRNISLPHSAYEAFGLAREGLNDALPGKEYAMEAAQAAEASKISNIRKVAKTPSSLIDFASRTESQTNDFFRKLATEEADRVFGKQKMFLDQANKMTDSSLRVQEENVKLQTEALMQGAQGKKDMLQGVENAAGKLTTTANQALTSKSQDEYLNILKKYLFGDKEKDKTATANLGGDPELNFFGEDPAVMAQAEFYKGIKQLFGDYQGYGD